MDNHEWLCRGKTARQKRRLVLADRDKQFIQLEKRQTELWKQRQKIMPVPVDEPYQRGWKRFFVLQEDVSQSPRAEFYEALLGKINTTEYHYDKSFKLKRWRKGFRNYPHEQKLGDVGLYDWRINKFEFTDAEKACFTRVEKYITNSMTWDVKFVISEPWRFKLIVAPNIVTHYKPVDNELEAEYAWIDNHICYNGLTNIIHALVYGRSQYREIHHDHGISTINALRKIPANSPMEAYLEIY